MRKVPVGREVAAGRKTLTAIGFAVSTLHSAAIKRASLF